MHAHARRALLWLVLCGLLALGGCAGVKVGSIEPSEYLAQRRADVLTSGALSAATRESLRVIGSEAKPCLADAPRCRREVLGAADERDILAVRTNARGEHVHLYQVRMVHFGSRTASRRHDGHAWRRWSRSLCLPSFMCAGARRSGDGLGGADGRT